MRKVYFNFKQHHISPSAYLDDWILPLFLNHLPFEACARIWDVLLLEGDSFLYRTALAILTILEPRLFFPDRRELLELLRSVRIFTFRNVHILNTILLEGKIKPLLTSHEEKAGHSMEVSTRYMVLMKSPCGNVSTKWKTGGRKAHGSGCCGGNFQTSRGVACPKAPAYSL